MTPTQFAVVIVFPGTQLSGVISAALAHNVHIIDKEAYKPGKDYAAMSRSYEPYINGSRILLLFVFSEGLAILANNEANLNMAVVRIREIEEEG
jgi:hypothetical protein